MPPKKKGGGAASKKAQEKAKIVDEYVPQSSASLRARRPQHFPGVCIFAAELTDLVFFCGKCSKTFGLKNKKNSKKVQKFVQRVEQQAEHKVQGGGRKGGASGSGGPPPTSAAAKKAALAAKLEELQLLNQPVLERPKKISSEEEAKRKAREAEEAERIRIANLPVEEQIEEERAKLKTKTPVTHELFEAWKDKKKAERQRREAEALAKAQKGMSKAERNRGGGLTGRALFEQHQDIFVDDAGASNEKYVRDEKAWIGDGEKDGAENEGGEDRNKPELEHEPPAEATGDDDAGEAGVGDESLFS